MNTRYLIKTLEKKTAFSTKSADQIGWLLIEESKLNNTYRLNKIQFQMDKRPQHKPGHTKPNRSYMGNS